MIKKNTNHMNHQASTIIVNQVQHFAAGGFPSPGIQGYEFSLIKIRYRQTGL